MPEEEVEEKVKQVEGIKVELLRPYLVNGRNMPAGSIVILDKNQGKYAVDNLDAKWCDPNAELTDPSPYEYKLQPRDENGKPISDSAAKIIAQAIKDAGKP